MTAVGVLTGRNLRKFTRNPQLLFFSLVQPVIFLTLFSQVFRSIVETPFFAQEWPGVTYIQFLVPATICTTIAMNATNSGIGIATDLQTGVIDRFRSMPIASSSVLVARSVSDLVRATIQGVFMLIVGMAIFGFRFGPGVGVAGAVAMILVVLPLNWGLSWLFIALGVGTKNAETTQLAGFMVTIPLMFASSAYVPIDQLPGWMQGFAEVNPLSAAVNAARGLALGTTGVGGPPVGDLVVKSLLYSFAVAAVGIPLALWAYRRSFK